MEVGRCGPSGGSGGQEFIDDAIPQNSKVVEVIIHAGNQVDSVQIVHETNSGVRQPLPAHGGAGGSRDSFILDADEFITGISGRFGSRVDSIQIHTNKQSSIRFGGSGGGADYQCQAPEGTEIVGFVGRSGSGIDAIGSVLRRR